MLKPQSHRRPFLVVKAQVIIFTNFFNYSTNFYTHRIVTLLANIMVDSLLWEMPKVCTWLRLAPELCSRLVPIVCPRMNYFLWKTRPLKLVLLPHQTHVTFQWNKVKQCTYFLHFRHFDEKNCLAVFLSRVNKNLPVMFLSQNVTFFTSM